MRQKIKKERITKREWYDRGGFANSALFRLQSRGGAWRYYVDVERAIMQRMGPDTTIMLDPVSRLLED